MKANDITLIMPYYNNSHILAFHCGVWWQYSDEVKEHMRIIIVDDCSEEAPAEPVLRRAKASLGLDVRLYRVNDSIEWNDVGARNLGAQECETDWMLLTDIDHVLPPDSAAHLMYVPDRREKLYFLARRWADGREEDPHCNSYMVTREAFWQAGGYDEDFAGVWGGDTEFVQLLQQELQSALLPDVALWLWQSAMPDGKTPRTKEQTAEYRRRRRDINSAKQRGGLPDRPVDPIRFNWERVL